MGIHLCTPTECILVAGQADNEDEAAAKEVAVAQIPKNPTDVTRLAREAAYVAVGLGVLGLRQAQIRRNQLRQHIAAEPSLEEKLGSLRAEVVRQVGQLDDLLGEALQRLDATVEPWEAHLPPPAREASHIARSRAHETHQHFRRLLSTLS
jgi:hypothetical protein